MRVIGHELGRVIILFPIEEVRPVRGFPLFGALEAIRNRYQFLKTPDLSKSLQELDREGYAFGNGKFTSQGETTVVNDLTIYPDGINVTCLDTAYAEEFLSDLIAWATDTFKIRPFVREPKKLYRSQVIVEFEKPISNLLKELSAVSNIISRPIAEFTGHANRVSLNRIDFAMDSTKIPGGLVPVPFIIERKVGMPHETERYISEAALPSRVHLETLRELEAQLG